MRHKSIVIKVVGDKEEKPEHDVHRPYLYKPCRRARWHTPRQLCNTRMSKTYSHEEVMEYAKNHNILYKEESKMKITREFILTRPAKGSGGDRYEEVHKPTESSMLGTIYVLQPYSRASGKITESIQITMEVEG